MVQGISSFFYERQVSLDVLVNVFFLYSFLGWCMECVVIRYREKGIWENRGFTKLPFCIIYGFGAMLGYALLRPLAGHNLLIYLVSAAGCTVFEYATGCLMMRLFGEFWWDYNHKPFNYKGMICLESTVAWGFLGLFVVHFLHGAIFRLILRIPRRVSSAVAALLLLAYAVDFLLSLRRAVRSAHANCEIHDACKVRDGKRWWNR